MIFEYDAICKFFDGLPFLSRDIGTFHVNGHRGSAHMNDDGFGFSRLT